MDETATLGEIILAIGSLVQWLQNHWHNNYSLDNVANNKLAYEQKRLKKLDALTEKLETI